jgi:hypothetical protein
LGREADNDGDLHDPGNLSRRRTKSLERSPFGVASIYAARRRRGGCDVRAPRGVARGTNYPASPVNRSGTQPGVKRERSGLGAGPPFWPTCYFSSSHSAFGLDKRRRTSKIYACRDAINGRVSPRSPYSLRPIWITPGTAALGARVRAPRGRVVVGINRGERQAFTG